MYDVITSQIRKCGARRFANYRQHVRWRQDRILLCGLPPNDSSTISRKWVVSPSKVLKEECPLRVPYTCISMPDVENADSANKFHVALSPERRLSSDVRQSFHS